MALLGLVAVLALTGSPTPLFTTTDSVSAAPVVDSAGVAAPRAQSGASYRVFATREGLVGGWTSSGHVITTWDYFVSLPACTTMSCPGASPGRAGMTNCGSLCYVKVINPATGACRTEPIYDVGPWFTVDDWWNPADVRFLNKLPSNRQVLPQGLPGAQAAWDGKNVGYGWGPNGIGGSDVYANVGNPAGIDLADGTYWSLGIGGVVGNWVDVEMLWQTGEDPASAAQGCGHRLGSGGGAIPKWTPTPVTPTPTVPLISWGTAKVTGTGGAGLNCRTAPSGSGTVIAVFPEGATVTLRGPAANGWYPVVCAGQAGYASSSYLTTTSTPTPTARTTQTATVTTTGTATSTTTTAATSTATPTGTIATTETSAATGTVTATGTITETPTASPTETPTDPASTATATRTSTTAPPPSATLRPSLTPTTGPANWGTGTVANTGGAGVNCRIGPSTANSVITVLSDGTRVQLTGPAANGWQPVVCAGRQGYISTPYLNAVPFTPTPVPTKAGTTPAATRTATATLPGSPTPTQTTTMATTPSPTSTPVRTATTSPTSAASGTPALPNWGTGTVRNTGGAGVNCRTAPSTSGGIIRAYAEGTVLQLTGPAANGWQPAVCNGKQGYISAQYLGTVAFTPTPTATQALSGALDVASPSSVTLPAEPSPTLPATDIAPVQVTPSETGAIAPTVTMTAELLPTPEPSPTDIPAEPTSPPEPTMETLTSAWVTGTGDSGLACMAAPSWDSDLVAVVPEGAEVTQIGLPLDGWQMVACGETRGFVDAAYLSPGPVTSEIPIAEDTEAAETAPSSESDDTQPPVDSLPQTFSFTPLSETSVLNTNPDVPRAGVSDGLLALGGPDGGMVVVSFEVSGFVDGTVVQATLLVTGAEGSSSGGAVIAIPGLIADPWNTTATSLQVLGGTEAGWLDGLSPGVQTSVDVTGVVSNGTITFVLMGSDSPAAIASSETGSGPILVVTASPNP